MYKVKVHNSCSCMMKSGMAEVLDFSTEDEAEKEAQAMLEKMQSSFCKKHDFVLNEKFGDYEIYIKPRN
ncbi:MAG: hypothetical protein H8E76_00200 [Helicobacteraceae bacterium]|nr:hypothetical protein [Candidatus Sulfurimonas ponti]